VSVPLEWYTDARGSVFTFNTTAAAMYRIEPNALEQEPTSVWR
jgi:hypothetical protein